MQHSFGSASALIAWWHQAISWTNIDLNHPGCSVAFTWEQFTRSALQLNLWHVFKNEIFTQITMTFPGGQWVNHPSASIQNALWNKKCCCGTSNGSIMIYKHLNTLGQRWYFSCPVALPRSIGGWACVWDQWATQIRCMSLLSRGDTCKWLLSQSCGTRQHLIPSVLAM